MKFKWIQLLSLFFILFFYHVAEYLIQKKNNPETTDYSSFLITYQYLAAYSLGVIEFLIECYFFPNKSALDSIIVWFGAFLVFVGLFIRFSAIIHGGRAFTHAIQTYRRNGHVLVQDGIYKYIRHPGYLGFFIFAVGTQIFLKNPISIIVFIIVLWKFFADRIPHEEYYLIKMFGDQYKEYRDRTPTYLPFIP